MVVYVPSHYNISLNDIFYISSYISLRSALKIKSFMFKIDRSIQWLRANTGCNIKNAMTLFLYHILIETINEIIMWCMIIVHKLLDIYILVFFKLSMQCQFAPAQLSVCILWVSWPGFNYLIILDIGIEWHIHDIYVIKADD